MLLHPEKRKVMNTMELNDLIGMGITHTPKNRHGRVALIQDDVVLVCDMDDGDAGRYSIFSLENGVLVLDGNVKPEDIDSALASAHDRFSARVATKEEAERAAREEQAAAEEAARLEKERQEKMGKAIEKHPCLSSRRKEKKPAIFLVCQNQNFKEESKNGYLWAPDTDSVSSHQEMQFVKKGDVVIHHFKKTIFAVSIANGDCRVEVNPYGRGHGFVVECDYDILNKANTSDLTNEKVKYGNHLYSPFDKRGQCNQGVYLTEINEELAVILLERALKYNPYDATLKDILRMI